MTGNSSQRRKALRAAQRNGTPVHKPKREKVEPEPRGEAEEPVYDLEEHLVEVDGRVCNFCFGPVFSEGDKYFCENEDCAFYDRPPFLRNLEKRSWLWRFFKRMWRAGK